MNSNNGNGVFLVALADFFGIGLLIVLSFIKNHFDMFCTITIISILLFIFIWYIHKLNKEEKLAEIEAKAKAESRKRAIAAEEKRRIEEEAEKLKLQKERYVKETSPKIYDLIALKDSSHLPVLDELRLLEKDLSLNFSIKYKYENFRFDTYIIDEVGREISYFADLAKRMEEGININNDNIMYYEVIKEKEYDLTEIIEASNNLLTEEEYIKIENMIINEKVNIPRRSPFETTKEYKERLSAVKSKYEIEYDSDDFSLQIDKEFNSPGGRINLKDNHYINFDMLKCYIRRAIQIQEYNSTEEARRKKERSELTLKLRYKILQRDNFKCQICGRGYEDGVKLHVDHIIPVAKGGRTEIDNLRTLCNECNMGKSDTIENEEKYIRYMEGNEENE